MCCRCASYVSNRVGTITPFPCVLMDLTPPEGGAGAGADRCVRLTRPLPPLEQVEEGEPGVSPRAPAPPSASDSEKAPVVKAKATHVIMSSLITSKPLRPGNRVGEWRGRAEFLQPPACRSLSSPAPQGQPGCSGGTSAEAALRWEAYPALSDVPRSGALPPLSAPAVFPLCVSVASGKLSQLWRLCPLHEAGVWSAVGSRIRQHSAWWPGRRLLLLLSQALLEEETHRGIAHLPCT